MPATHDRFFMHINLLRQYELFKFTCNGYVNVFESPWNTRRRRVFVSIPGRYAHYLKFAMVGRHDR